MNTKPKVDNDTISIESRKNSIDSQIPIIKIVIRKYQKLAKELLNCQEIGVRSKEELEKAFIFTTKLENELLTNEKMVKDIMQGEMVIEHLQLTMQTMPEHMRNQTILTMKETQRAEKQKLSIINPSDSNAFRPDQLVRLE